MKELKLNIQIFITFLLTLLLYFGYLDILHLWNPDEPRYVEVVREMFSMKSFLLPHLNGELYAHKPPLFFWTMAFFVKLLNSYDVWVFRLTPAFSGFFIVFFTFLYSKKIFNKKVGLYSAFILSTSVTLVHLSRRCNIDTYFSLFILLAIMFLHFAINSDKNFKKFIFLSCIFQGLGVITKGPLAFIFPFITYILYIFFTNNKKLLKKTPWFWGGAIIFSVILIWLIPAGMAGGKEYFDALVFKHTIKRYASGINHPHNFFYYFYMFPLDFLPWSLFLPFILKYGLFNRKTIINKEIIWFLCWFLGGFIFMSFSTEKRGLYLLPLYPAAAIIFGYYLINYKDYVKNKIFKYPFYIILFAIIFSSLAMPIIYYIKLHKISVVLNILTAISFWGGIFLLKTDKKSLFVLYVLFALCIFNVYSFMFPFGNFQKSPKIFIQDMSKYIDDWDKMAFFNFYNPGINFYLKKDYIKKTRNLDELKNFIKNGTKYIFVKNKSVAKVEDFFKRENIKYKLILIRNFGHRILYFYKIEN